MLTGDTLLLNLTADAESMQANLQPLESFVRALPRQGFTPQTRLETLPAQDEGFTIPAQVNYVGKGAKLYDLGYRLHGSIYVINNYLGTTYLWEKIRVQGGAYGGFASFDSHTGIWAFLSYRDPNLEATLENYDRTADFLRTLDVPASEIERAIIGTIGNMDAYQLPDAKGWTSLNHYLTGLDDSARQWQRDEVLGTSLKHFHQFAAVLDAVRAGQVVVLGAEDKIRAAAQNGLPLAIQKVL